jgi:hypothetical protein
MKYSLHAVLEKEEMVLSHGEEKNISQMGDHMEVMGEMVGISSSKPRLTRLPSFVIDMPKISKRSMVSVELPKKCMVRLPKIRFWRFQ